MKDTFYEGDLVEILPYGYVETHYGIFEENWDKLVQGNPFTIRTIRGDKIYFEETPYWVKSPALVRYNPCVVAVEDLL